MVYINIKNPAPVVYIPLHGWEGNAGGLQLSAKNTTDHTNIALTTTEVCRVGFLACVHLAGPQDLYPGEWEYTLADALGVPVSTGLMKGYSCDKADPVEYAIETNVVQYGE